MRMFLQSIAQACIVLLLACLTSLTASRALAATPPVVRDFELISINTNGVSSGDGASINPVISSNGQFIAFVSKAANLVPNDTNGLQDVFWRDRQAGVTRLVSRTPSGFSGNGESDSPAISADGRYVAFHSRASNLVESDGNTNYDVFLWDSQDNSVTLVSRTAAGVGGAGDSFTPHLSANGRVVTFLSTATNLVAGDTNGTSDAFARDMDQGVTYLVSINTNGVAGNGASSVPVISANGRYVAFLSAASDLVTNDYNTLNDVFVHDLQTRTTKLVSVNVAGTGSGNRISFDPVISADGRYIAFASQATNLVTLPDTNDFPDVFVRDMQLGVTKLVSVNAAGTAAGGNGGDNSLLPASSSPFLSEDGTKVLFVSLAADLVANDTNGKQDVFLRDHVNGTTTLISTNRFGTGAGNGASGIGAFSLSTDVRYVAFFSSASDIGPADLNGKTDVFLRDLQTGTTKIISRATLGGFAGTGHSYQPVMSADGSTVLFTSEADNLDDRDHNGVTDILTAAPSLPAPSFGTVDLGVSVASVGPQVVGSNFTFNITVTNNSDQVASTVRVMGQGRFNVASVGVTLGTATNPAGGGLAWNIDSLAAHETATATLVMSPQGPGVLRYVATVMSFDQADANPADNVATTDITVNHGVNGAVFDLPNGTNYISRTNSPFFAGILSKSYTLEDFESGVFNIPGVTASSGQVLGASAATHSVDADDGVLDGSGTNGHSFFVAGTNVVFTFDPTVLGRLPTKVGIVLTAPVGPGVSGVRLEAFDTNGVSLGAFDMAAGQFSGVEFPGGISALRVSASQPGFEVDHLQFDILPVNRPPSVTLRAGNNGGGGALKVGYYDMNAGQGAAIQRPAIATAGQTPVPVTDLSDAGLAGLNVLIVENPSNSSYGNDYLAHLTSISNAVSHGLVLMIFDRYVTQAASILPGGAAINVVRDLSDDNNITVLATNSLVASGPGGVVNDTTLDGGNHSYHGYATAMSLPPGAESLLSRTNTADIIMFSYAQGAGHVIYSTVPLDYYLGGNNPAGFAANYAPNSVAYAASLAGLGQLTVLENSGPYQQTGFASYSVGPAAEAGQHIVNISVTTDNAGLFSSAPALDANGTLTFTPARNAFGTAVVTVVVQDDGGTANGGMDRATNSFTIAVLSANQPPTFTINPASVDPARQPKVVTAWGDNTAGQTSVPPGLRNVVAIAAGEQHGLALLLDGTVVGWGDNSYGQATSPEGLANATAIAAGAFHSLALRADGTVVAWGDDGDGQATVPAGLSNVISIAAGYDHSLALKGDGTVVAWGYNSDGQTTVPPGLSNVVAVAAGIYHSLALRSDGTVVAWGANGQGQRDVPVNVSNVAAIAASYYHNVALMRDGSVTAWGYNGSGQTNVPAGLTNVIAIAAGAADSLAVRRDGTVVVWGDNASGQTNVPSGLVNVSSVSSGHGFCLALTPQLTATGTNLTVLEDSGPITIPGYVTNISAVEVGQTVSFTLSNNNGALFSAAPALDATGKLTFTSALNASGSATVTLIAHDNGGTANGGVDVSAPQTFVINVIPVNDVPSFTLATTNLTLIEDSGSFVLTNFAHAVAGPADEAGQIVSFLVTVDNAALFSTLPAIGTDGTLSLTTAPNANGSATVTVMARDNGGTANGGVDTSAAQTFVIQVTPVNDAPQTLFAMGSITVLEGSGAFSRDGFATFSTGPADESGQLITSTLVLTGHPEYFSVAPSIDNSGTLTFTLAPNAYGMTLVSVITQDDGGTANGGVDRGTNTFTIIITPVNHAPVITFATNNLVALEDSGPQTKPGFVTTVGGPANETGQGITNYTVSNNQPALFAAPPAIALNGVLTFTPAANANGSAVVTVVAQDDGGTANGGVDKATNTFTITITPVNDAPSFTFNLAVQPLVTNITHWGWDRAGMQQVPADFTNAVQIAAGGYHVLGLRSDGTVVGWAGAAVGGENQVPAGLANILAVAAGSFFSLALDNTGHVLAWGNNNTGQTNVPAGLVGVTAIAAGDSHAVALKGDGTLIAWGDNSSGQTNVPGDLSNVAAISANGAHTLVLKRDGTVVAWGLNNQGQVNVPNDLTNVTAISAGFFHSLALKADGTVVAWGFNGMGQATVPAGLSNVVAIAGGVYHSLALRSDGTVAAWGYNNVGQASVPEGLAGVTQIFAGNATSFALGTNVTFGPSITVLENSGATNVLAVTRISAGPADEAGQTVAFTLANDNPALFSSQPAIAPDGTLSFTPAATGFGYARVTVVAQDNGGTANGGVDKTTNTFVIRVVPVNNAPGFTLSLPIQPLLTNVTHWGWNNALQQAVPGDFTNAVQISAGGSHVLGLRSDGTVVAWGYDANGQATVPVGLGNVTSVAAGGAFSLALDRNGTVHAWGLGDRGQTNVPSGLSGVTAIAAGDSHALALKTDGTVVAWGNNNFGQTNVPVGLNSVIAIATSDSLSLALKRDGTVVGWGDNSNGMKATVPAGLANVVAIAAGSAHGVALLADGTVTTWGDNYFNQTNVPAGLNNVVAITAGAWHTLALRTDGTVVAWGRNDYGETTVPVGLAGGTRINAGLLTSFVIGTNQVTGPAVFVQEDSGLVSVLAATNIVAGPANESGQAVNFMLTTDNPSLFSSQPTMATDGTLTFTPANGVLGVARVTVTARDNGGTGNGGVDTSAPQTFAIVVANAAPVVAFATNQIVVLEHAGPQTLSGFVTGRPGPALQSVQHITNYSVLVPPSGLFADGPHVALDGTLTFTAAVTANGTTTVSVIAEDDGGIANGGINRSTNSFTLTIIPVNDAPSFVFGVPRRFANPAAINIVDVAPAAPYPATINVSGVTAAVTNVSVTLFGLTHGFLADTSFLLVGPQGQKSMLIRGPNNYAGQGGAYNLTLTIDSNPANPLMENLTLQSGHTYRPTMTYGADNNLPSPAPAGPYVADLSVFNGVDPNGVWSLYVVDGASGDTGIVAGGWSLAFNNELPDVAVLENAGTYSRTGFVTNILAGPSDELTQSVSFTLTNDNPALFSTAPALDASGTLTFTPALHANGRATVSVIAQDNGGTANGGTDTATQTFTITVIPVNDAPSFAFPPYANWTAHDTNRSWSAIASSADGNKLVALVGGGQIYTSTNSGATWTARETNRTWSAIATSADGTKLVAGALKDFIYVSADSGLTWTPQLPQSLQTSERLGNWYSVASSADGTKLAAVDYGAPNRRQNGGFIYTSTDSGLNWTARAQAMLWNSIASSADGTRLAATVNGGQIYTSTDSGVTWTARDSSRSWASVASSADGMKLAAVCFDTNGFGVIYTSTDSGTNWALQVNGVYTFAGAIASSADGTRLAAVGYDINGNGMIYTSTNSGTNWTAELTAGIRNWWPIAMSADGTQLVAAEDGGQIYTSSGIAVTFTITVLEDSGNYTQSNVVTGISAGPPNESSQTVRVTLTNNNNGLFSSQPAVDANGTLTFTPATNANGTATVTFIAMDDGGTANGGTNQTTRTITITVTPVNDPPTISFAMPTVTVLEDSGPSMIAGFVTAGVGPADEAGQSITNYTVTASVPELFSVQPSIAFNGTLSFTPALHASGTAIVTVIAQDNGGIFNGGVDTTTNTFNITVLPVNQPPSFTLYTTSVTQHTVVAWGDNGSGQLTVPAGLTNVSAIAAGYLHGLAVSQAGVGIGWGENAFNAANVPADFTNLTAISAGQYHGLALRTDGTVGAWGHNLSGETNVPANLTNVIAVAAGGYHSLALKRDGAVVAWGDNGSGQSDVPVGLSNVTAIAAGYDHSVALCSNGTLVAWGSNSDGQTTIPVGVTNVVAIAAGYHHTLAVNRDGTVSAWGANESGQSTVPVGLSNVTAVAAGSYHSVALRRDGTVVAWGLNTSAQTTIPATVTNATAIAAGENFTLALVPVVFTGPLVVSVLEDAGPQSQIVLTNVSPGPPNESGQTVSITVTNNNPGLFSVAPAIDANGRVTFTPALHANGMATVAVIAQDNGGTANGGMDTTIQTFTINVLPVNDAPSFTLPFGLTVATNFSVIAWGLNGDGQTNVPAGLSGVTAIAGGGYHTVALQSNGTVLVWGGTNQGQSTIPPGLSSVTAIAAGDFHTVVMRNDGSVVAWGANNYGQATVPAGLSGVTAVAAGGYNGYFAHSVALKNNGLVVAWGSNDNGQTNVPAGLNGVTAIAAGGAHTVALKSDGTVVAWGYNGYGQTNVPVGLTGVKAIAAGFSHTVALKSDGTVVAWGYNSDGQTTVPPGLTGVTAIAAGYFYTMALKSDGTVVAWGNNGDGQTTVPAGLNGVTAVAAGGYHAAALYPVYVTNGTLGITVLEDSGLYTQANLVTGVSPGPVNESAQTVMVTLANDNNALFSSQPAVDANGTLTFTPASHANGSATVTVVALDNGGTTNGGINQSSQTFTITVLPVNHAPAYALSYWSDWTPQESSRAWYAIASSADGSKLAAVDSGGYIYTSTNSGAAWMAQTSSGATNWDAIASSADGTKLVATVNNGQIYTSTDSGSTWVARATSQQWRCVASSADGSTLVAGVENGQLYTSTDSGQTWTARANSQVWLGVACSADGAKMVAVAIYGQIYASTDSGQTWTARSGQKAWRPVASSADGTKLVAAEQGGQIYTSTDSGLTWTARESNRNWYFLASSADGSTLAAVADSDQIYVSTDSGVTWAARESSRGWRGITSSADGTKLAAVAPGEKIYTSTKAVTLNVLEDSGPYSQAGFVSAISAGPSNESAQTVSFTVTNNNPTLFNLQPVVAVNGTLTFTPSADANGSATVTVVAQDNGGTANGGVNQSSQTFTIIITPVNDAPSVNFTTNNLQAGVNGAQSIAGFAAFSVGPANEAGQSITNVFTTNSNPALFSVQPALAANGTLTFTATASTGTAMVTVIVQDNGGTANGGQNTATNTFTITLNPVNQAPYFTFTTAPDQDGVQSWVRTVSANTGSGVKVVTDSSGNVIVAGDELDSRQVNGMTVVKYSPDGTVLWTNHFYDASGQYNQAAQVKGLAADSAGNVFVTGQSEISYGEGADLQWVTIKYGGTDGAPNWTNYFHEVNNDVPAGLVVDGTGNVIVTGTFYNATNQNYDYLTIKYAGNGTPVWTNITSGTGTGDDAPKSLALDSNGNVLVTGTAFNGFSKEIFTVKYSAAGLPMWTNVFDGNSQGDDGGLVVATDSTGSVLVLGSVLQDGYLQYITLKYSASGTPVWTNLFYRTGSGDYPVTMAVDGADNVIVVGETWNGPDADFTAIKYLPSGTPAWTNHLDVAIDSADIPHAVAINAAGDVFITGETLAGNSKDYLTIKYSAAGTPVWTNTYNGTLNGNDVAGAIAVDTNGNAYVTGTADNAFTTIKYAFIAGNSDQSVNASVTGRILTTSNFIATTSVGAASETQSQAITNYIVSNDYPALFTMQPAIDLNGTLTYQLSGLPGVAIVTVIAQDNGGTLFGGQNQSQARRFKITVRQAILDRQAVLYVWNGGPGDWNDSTKWTPTGVPGAIDSAQIDSGTVAVTNSVLVSRLVLTGGSLTGGGVLAVTTGVTWTGGTMDGSGQTTIPRNSVLTLSDATDKALNRRLDNYGTVVWSGARITGDNGPVLNNQSGAVFDIQTDATLFESFSGGTRTFNNYGTLRKSAGTGTTSIYGTLNNSATIEVQTGSVSPIDSANLGDTRFSGTGRFLVNSGTLTLKGTLTVVAGANVEFAGGSLQGTGTLKGTLNWTGGYMDGTGIFTVATNGALTISGGGEKRLNQRLDNYGTVTWSGYRITGDNYPIFNNEAGALFDIQTDSTIFDSYTVTPGSLNNRGLLRKSGGTGTISFTGALNNYGLGAVNSNGLIQVQSGILSIQAGGAGTGEFAAASGAEVDFAAGTYTWSDGVRISGNGLSRVLGATVIVPTNATTTVVGTLEIGAGFMSGDGNVNVLAGAQLLWTGGVMGGQTGDHGVTTIASNAVLTVSGPTEKSLNRRLDNFGRMTWTGARITSDYFAAISNQLGALFDIQTDDTLMASYTSNPGTINNLGTVRKSAGTRAATIYGPFNNASLLDVQTGVVTLLGGGAGAGQYNASAGAAVEFQGVTYVLNQGARLTGAGVSRLLGATLAVPTNATVSFEGTFLLANGTLSGDGNVSVMGTLNWTGGMMAGNGITKVQTNGGLTITGPTEKQLNRRLDNFGTVTWTGERITGDNYPVFNNQPGALFDIQTDNTIFASYSATFGALNNLGTVRKSAGTGATTFYGALNNSGLLEIRTGTVSLLGDYTPLSSSSLRVYLGGLTAGTQSGQLLVGGTTALAGTLDIVLTNNFLPVTADAILIVSSTSLNGTFASITGGTLGGGLVLTPTYLATTGVTLVAGIGIPGSIPPPSLAPVALDGQRQLRFPASPVGYELQTTTELGPNAVWSPVRATVEVEQGVHVIRLSDTGSVRFYRLVPTGSTRGLTNPAP